MGLFRRLKRSPHIHDDLGSLFGGHVAEGRILDLPAGEGVNTRGLSEAGYEVQAADLHPEACERQGLICDRVDMTQALPYADDSFDGVLHAEGIEHVDNQVAVLGELARVLRPGGLLVLTTPNVLHLEGRWGALLTGHAHARRAMVVSSKAYWGAGRKGNDPGTYFGHVFLVNYFQLRVYLEHVGLEVVGVDTTRWSLRSLVLAPFLWLPVALATRRITRRKVSRIPPELRRKILADVLSPALLFGRKLILLARKPI